MATYQTWITEALEELGLIAAGETPSAADSDYCFRRYNRLVNTCAAERMAHPTPLTRTTWTITQAASFTVGPAATINRARPVFVDGISYFDPTQSIPVEVPLRLLTDDEYAAWAMKTQTTPIPVAAYYSPVYDASGFSALYLLPIPTQSLTGVMYAPTAVPEAAALTSTAALPPGYQEFFVTNLALLIAPGFKVQPTRELIERARETKAIVKRSNARLMEMEIDPGATQGGRSAYDILTDSYH